MKELREFILLMVTIYPLFEDDIYAFYELCLDEIANGELESNEIELCYNSINELIKEK